MQDIFSKNVIGDFMTLFGKSKKSRSIEEIESNLKKLREERMKLEKRQMLLMQEAKEKERLLKLKYGKEPKALTKKRLAKVVGFLDTWGKSSLRMADISYPKKNKK